MQPPVRANLPVAHLERGFPPGYPTRGFVTRRRRVFAALPVAIGVAIGTMGAVVAPLSHAFASGPQALIFGPTVIGAPSLEQQDLVSQGWTVTVATGATWDAMSASQFSAYQLLVFGDPSCSTNPAIQNAAVANETTWAPLVNGNVLVIGTDPVFHYDVGVAGAGVLVSHALAYAGAQPGRTGLYVDLSCFYISGGARTSPLLNGIEPGFSIYPETSCAATIHVVASAQQLIGITDSDLSNWSCSVHEYFGTWPSDFVPYAVDTAASATVASGICPNPPYQPPDGTAGGCPYIIGRGGGLSAGSVGLAGPAGAALPGTNQTLTASVQSGGSPVSGATVTLNDVSGPSSGRTTTVTTDAAGSATYTYTSAGGGTDEWVATYTPPGFALETSAQAPVVWLLASPFTASATPSSVGYGATSTLAESGLPGVSTGTVTFTTGAATLCTLTRPATTCTTSASLAGATYPITATYSGDGTYGSSTATTVLTVTPVAAPFTASATPASVPVGTPSTLAESGLPGNATGTVTFTSGGNTLCTATLAATSCLTATSLVAGVYAITATYSGDGNYIGSTASTSLTVTQVASSFTASAMPSTVPFGTASTLAESGLAGNSTGPVTFTSGGRILCTATRPGATGCATSAALAVGTYAITATYAGDGSYTGSTAATSLTVTVATTTFVATAAPAGVPYGTSSTLAETGLPVGATGTVTFSSGATLCRATLPTTSCTTSTALAAGTYPITATYPGDVNDTASTATTTLTVTLAATAFTVSATPASVPFGVNPTLLESGLAGATGTVVYTSGATPLCTATLPAATCVPSVFFGVGTYPVTATYSGDADHTGSTASTTYTVTRAATTTTVTSSLNPAAPDQRIVYTAAVVSNPGSGTVTFTDDGLTIAGCSAVPVNALTGAATCETTYPHSGTYLIAAVFNGSANDAPSTSPTVGVRSLVEAIQVAIVVPVTGGDAAATGIVAGGSLSLLGLLLMLSAGRRRRRRA
ncbi:MAG TPA: Ig-like domain repeat protein [Candidatus Saccharimonadales bacterium]|nr:Ig-like domain repeat protein [Candidatus Saccharimonadales bacterium]